MHLAVTIRRDEDIEEIKDLVETLRKLWSAGTVTILEAPSDLNYPYPFPVVTISDEELHRSRLFGPEAVDKLRDLVARG